MKHIVIAIVLVVAILQINAFAQNNNCPQVILKMNFSDKEESIYYEPYINVGMLHTRTPLKFYWSDKDNNTSDVGLLDKNRYTNMSIGEVSVGKKYKLVFKVTGLEDRDMFVIHGSKTCHRVETIINGKNAVIEEINIVYAEDKPFYKLSTPIQYIELKGMPTEKPKYGKAKPVVEKIIITQE